MEFTSYTYFAFLAVALLIHRTLSSKSLLVAASYVFYGWVHPWFCLLMAGSTVLDYQVGLAMERMPKQKKKLLLISLIGNLGLLATFKYFNFFLENLQTLGIARETSTWNILLPVGISFYTFQTLSYTIDVYRGELKARKNFVDFALFVSFFPQLVAGPIERAGRLLPQIEKLPQKPLKGALALIITGFFKKLVVADNLAEWVDRVFSLQPPPWPIFLAGSLAFSIQIYADFSAYTDIARGSARLLGIELMENFRSPFLAHSPSDFWKRWHISFSSWIRDYLYIPLGGNRRWPALALIVTMSLSGLWHGASWHFVAWGLFHGALLITYRNLSLGGRWQPVGLERGAAVLTFQCLNIFAWSLFRTPTLSWWVKAVFQPIQLSEDVLVVTLFLLLLSLTYSLPWIFRARGQGTELKSWHLFACWCIFLFANRSPEPFIYFQF